ncbi:NADH-ubiquinone oxidoreductase chain N [hydrothermal vent metagenome]|uniref:NADH-ubiquinone oxidoreductase chain N n=1 Tax=hydrothermal vent metagenome TaxID=652676 RepID=A0A1W1CBL1_9ZZZZ
MNINFDLSQLFFIIPEIFLLTSVVVILILSLFLSKKNQETTYYLSQFTLLLTSIFLLFLVGSDTQIILNDQFIFDNLSNSLKIVVIVFSMMFLLYSRYYLKVHRFYSNEYFILSLLAIFGTMIMMSGYSLLTIYLGLELLSLSLYTLIAMAKHRVNAVEASLKYFVLGALSSGILLYGMSMLYGITGSLNIIDISQTTQQIMTDRELLVLNFGLTFVIIGIAFKLGAVPFHMWIPDVYHGAPTAVTMFLSSIPKISAFVIMVRLVHDALGGLISHWQELLLILSILSIVLGTLVAIVQTNLKRLLAYSTISHVGFVLLGFAVGSIDGIASGLFYVLVYSLVSLSGFGVIIYLNSKGFEAENISDYNGLAKSHPSLALMMLIVILAMAGIPPLIGFYSKFYIIQQVLNAGFVELAIVAVIFAVIGAYYYLRVIKAMYFETSEREFKIYNVVDIKLMLIINTLMIVIFSLFPDYWIEFSKSLLS